MKIGNVVLDNNVILAPMAGITDKSYRKIAKDMGAGLVVTEMISAKGIYYNDKKTKKLLNLENEKSPIAVQIFGSDPDIIEYIIKNNLNNREDIDIIDINMGCPAPKIVNNNDGSALLKDLERAEKILESMVSVSKKPITVKTRMGWNNKILSGIQLGKIAEKVGVSAITIHGRTREMYYGGSANWDYIKEMKEELNIPVIGNGDIFTPNDATRMMEYTKCDGIAIGRGAIGNPWLIKRIINSIKGKEDILPTSEEKVDMIKKHLIMTCEDKGEKIGVPEMRKHIAWYLKGMPDSKKLKDKINRMSSLEEVITVLDDYILELC